MRVTHLLPLAITAAALVIPDEATADQLRLDPQEEPQVDSVPWEDLFGWNDIRSKAEDVVSSLVETSHSTIDQAMAFASEVGEDVKQRMHSCGDSNPWNEEIFKTDPRDWLDDDKKEDTTDHGHHGHHGHHDHKPNMTIYELIKASKYTTRLAQVIDEDGDLVSVLNSTSSNYTFFAPTDHAFEKLPDDMDPPTKEGIKKTLLYHVSPDFYPAGRVLLSHTIPTLLKEKELGDFPQRIRFGLGFKGLELNFYSRVVAVNIVRYHSPGLATHLVVITNDGDK